MARPAARQGDPVIAVDTHIVLVPTAGGPAPTPLPHPFSGRLTDGLSPDVYVDGLAAATVGSVATNQPPHVPTAPGTSFQIPPSNRGTVQAGSATVLVNGRQMARLNEVVVTCNDPADLPVGSITAGSPTVMVG
jgi:uncharacterized Zn-binding protein involved in type VI secretion